MNAEAQRIAIAEACGWLDIADRPDLFPYPECESPLSGKPKNRPGVEFALIPDYLSDLNAMHEAEKVLDRHQRDAFDDIVCALCARENGINQGSDAFPYQGIHATAEQRAEAFLRTIGKWAE